MERNLAPLDQRAFLDVLRREGIAEDACFLQKPFAIGDLVEALRAAI